MSEIEKFKKQREELIRSNGSNKELKDSADVFLTKSAKVNYSYNFS